MLQRLTAQPHTWAASQKDGRKHMQTCTTVQRARVKANGLRTGLHLLQQVVDANLTALYEVNEHSEALDNGCS